ncbi:MAG: FliG C-terminal domain-containing protein [Candidatus Auribacterota bacterium]|nr:FliG C-terminal domain-containing protein [Candidatus Auribacterota bacterium]
MARSKSLNLSGIVFFLTTALFLSSGTAVLSQSIQRSDAAQLAAGIGASLQTKLDTMIGPRRSIVNVDVTISDRFSGRGMESVRALETIPGVMVGAPDEREAAAQAARINSLSSQISSMHIEIDVDDSLPEEDIGTPENPGKIEKAVTRWAKLSPARGDTIHIIPMAWQDHAPPSATQQNYLLYSILALVALLILVAAIYFPMRKMKGGTGTDDEGAVEDRARLRKEEMEEIAKMFATSSSDTSEFTLKAIKDLLHEQGIEAMAAGGVGKGGPDSSGVLEEIRDLIGTPPQESDALLTEMRDTLSDLLDDQRRTGGRGGMMPAGTPGVAAAPAGGGGGGGGGLGGGGGAMDDGAVDSMKSEIVGALGNLEEIMAQQLEKAPPTEGTEQPFKYLKSTDPDEIILLVKNEEPKLAAAVLSQIEPHAAAAAFEGMDEEKQFEIARAMTQLTEEEDMAGEIKDFLERKLKIVRLHKDYEPVMGSRVLADILSTSRYAAAMVMLEKMESKNPAMAAEVRKRMFLFEDVETLEDKDIEIVIHNLSHEIIAYALTEAEDNILNKFFKNMTEKAQAMVKEEIETVKKVTIEEEGRELPFNQAILSVDQTIIDEIFRTVDRTTLKMALRGASGDVMEKFFTGLTERAVAMMKEDLEVMGGISRARADDAQDEIMDILRQLSSKSLSAQHDIIATIRKLDHEGQITVKRFQEETI